MLCLLSTAAFAAVPKAGENFYLYDEADVISYEDEGVIFYNNEALEKACGAQIVIAAVKTTGSKTIEKYTYELFNKWEVGDKKKDNGFLLVMAIEDQDAYLCQGTGAERIIDAGELKLFMNDYLADDFFAGRYSEGAVKIFKALFETVRDYYGINLAFMDEEALTRAGKLGGTAEWDSAPGDRAPKADKDSGNDTLSTILGAIIVIAIIVAIVARPRKRKGYVAPAPAPAPTVVVAPRTRVVRTTRTYAPRSGSFWGTATRSTSSSPRPVSSTRSSGWTSSSSTRSSTARSGSGFSSGSRSSVTRSSSSSRSGFSGGRGGGGSSRGSGAGFSR